MIREVKASLDPACPFCREPLPTSDEGCDKQRMKRIEANDPVAMRREGVEQYNKGDYVRAFEYYLKAAELGDVDAHLKLGRLYQFGRGVEKEMGKEIHHLEEAAIGGHPYARRNLAWHEWNNDNKERAARHLIIAANLGEDASIKLLLKAFKGGLIDKDDLATALRAHQAAVEETKSPQREAAEEYYRNKRRR